VGAEAATLDPVVIAPVRTILDQYFHYFAMAVRDAHSQNLIAAEDPEAAARWLFSYFEGSITHARIRNDPELLRDLGAGGMQLLGVRRGKVAA
jgi:TetR/AcrR family transcriptional repressor of nem operon